MTVYDDFTAGIAIQAPRLVATRSKKYAGLRGAKVVRNVFLDEQGVRTAPGYTRMYEDDLPGPVRGLVYYTRRGGGVAVSELLAISDGKLFKDTTLVWEEVEDELADVKTRFQVYNGYAIFVNGTDATKQYDGSVVTDVDFEDAGGDPVTDIFPADARPTFILKHQNRLFYMNDVNYPYRVWTPDAGTHNIFDNNSEVFDVDLGDGDPVMAGASLTTGIAVIFKTSAIYALKGTNPFDSEFSPFQLESFSQEVGCIAPDTVISVGSDVYFLSDRGYKRLRYVSVTGNLTDADPLNPAKPILDTLDLDRAGQASATFNAVERCIYLSIPVRGGGWTTLLFNVVTEGIMQRDGFNITNQIYVKQTQRHYFSRDEVGDEPEYRVMINGITNTYDGVPFSSEWESLLLGTDQMNLRKFFCKFLAYTRVYNGSQVQCGVRLVNVDGAITTRLLDFGDATGVDGWDIGKWDVALWDNALANVLRQSRIGRGVAISIFFRAAAGAAFFFDRIELDIESRGYARR